MTTGTAATVSAEDVLKLSRVISNLTHQLKMQRDILRQRGMDVPPGTIQGLETIHIELEKLSPKVAEQTNELDQLRTLVDTTAIINSSLDLDRALRLIMDTILELTRAERGYIMLRNEGSGEMTIRYARGMDQQDLESDSLVVSKSIVQEVVQSGEPVVTTNAQQDQRFAGQKSIVGFNLRSILCVPLILKGNVQGVVYADNSIRDGIFGRKELQLLVAVASQAALAIENAKLFEQVRATLEEITEIKTLLDNILASIASGVITTDAENRITTYNPSAEIIIGVPSQLTLGHYFQESIQALYSEIQSFMQAIRTENQSFTIEAEPTFEGERRNLNLKMSPLRDATNTTQGVALVVDDLTELKKRDKMLDAIRRYLPPAMVDNIHNIDRIGLAGERRFVTVIFVEVRAFNTFPAHLKAGQLMELLNLYMTVGTDAIHRYSGVIDKYMGSEIMGLFNTQLNPSESHAWDAVQAAIDMTRDFQELYTRLGENPTVPFYRIGIHSGEATLGNVGGTSRREFSAIGDTINLGKRLQENAVTGQFIISEETYAACGTQLKSLPGIEIIQRDPLQVKGRLQIAQVYEIRPTRR